MSQPVSISSYTLLRNNQLIADGKVIFEKQGVPLNDFLDSAYAHFGISYPKFFKMDNLCRVGFIAAEILMRSFDSAQDDSHGERSRTDAERSHGERSRTIAEEKAIVLSTRNSSLDTDLRYQESTKTSASPALFVYTLPNILVGELSIRNGMKGETACFVFDIFDAAFQVNYVNGLFASGRTKTCLSGWADYLEGKGEAFFYLAVPGSGLHSLKHDTDSVQKIFSNP